MANYVPFMRSNYFEVKDAAAFEAFCTKWDVELTRGGGERRESPLYGFLANGEMGLPPCYWDAAQDDFVEGEFVKELATHLADGWVAIIREVGYEKYRYLVGFTVAVNSKGEILEITLDEIYAKAKSLGSHVTRCEY